MPQSKMGYPNRRWAISIFEVYRQDLAGTSVGSEQLTGNLQFIRIVFLRQCYEIISESLWFHGRKQNRQVHCSYSPARVFIFTTLLSKATLHTPWFIQTNKTKYGTNIAYSVSVMWVRIRLSPLTHIHFLTFGTLSQEIK